MDFNFAIKVIIISASGALAPGPLTVSSIALGAKNSWKAGINIAIGHTLVEFPLVLLIAYGISTLLTNQWIKTTLGITGGLFLILFAILTLKDALNPKITTNTNNKKYKSPIIVGIALSLFNPYFITWWIGVGSPLILEALKDLSIIGLTLFYITHVWLDYLWLTLTSTIGSASKINIKTYKIILSTLAITVLYFGIEMIIKHL